MAASTSSKASELSKAEYLKRYLSADKDGKKAKGKLKKKLRKMHEKGWVDGNVVIQLVVCVLAVKLAEVAALAPRCLVLLVFEWKVHELIAFTSLVQDS